MNKTTLNVAVIVSGIDEEYQNTILQGIQEFGSAHNINICHFIAYGGILKNHKYDMGEFNIYELANFDLLDGVILLTNTISSPALAEKIVERVRKSGIPAVSIDNKFDGFYHIGIDNFSAMEGIVEHIVKDHGAKRINYISGPSDNPESILRFKAYKEVLERNGFPIEEERIYNGLFRGEDGREAIRFFLNSSLEFPDAIICANDAMALSAVIELEKIGKNVPEDVMVTGFDSIYAAQNYSPEISSVTRPLRKSGELACKIIYDHINGIKNEKSYILPTQNNFAESCGCSNLFIDEISKFKKTNYRTLEAYNIYVQMINRMSCELEECLTFEENIAAIKEYVMEIKCEKFFLCMCSNWDEDLEDNEVSSIGYTKTVTPVLAFINGQFVDYPEFESSQMLPELHMPPELLMETQKSNNYYFMPIHFRERCLGYSVICNCQFPMESALYHTWVLNISNSIENIRKIRCLDKMVKKLDQLSIVDPLVHIYNRNGFNKKTGPLYEECKKNHQKVMVMFIDMDELKYINDKFGHKEGDFALYSIASALRNSTDESKGQITARFGGDEFIIFASNFDEKGAEKMAENINAYLDKVNETSGKPYNIHASIGHYITLLDESTKIDKIITMADQIMYENKKKKKSQKNKV